MTFPLGTPVNRKPPPGLQPVTGRPGWWRHPCTGAEQYLDPPRTPTFPDVQTPPPVIEYGDDDTIWPCCGDEE